MKEAKMVISDLHAKLQSAEQKITALSETIDSQKQTNLAFVNKLEVAEKEANMWHNKYNQSADSEDSLFEQAIKATKQREDALDNNIRLIEERLKAQRQVEQQQSTYTDLEADYKGLQAQVAVLRSMLNRSRMAFISLIDYKLLPSKEYEKTANKLASDIFCALSATQAEAAKQHELLNKVFIEASKICSDMALGNPVVLMQLNLAVCNYTKYRVEA
jgi:DNA repair exonuclease SbcCD ATPase subunit